MSELSPYQLDRAIVDWQESGSPASSAYGDIYFSPRLGLEETEYVFLQHNHLAPRWRQLAQQQAQSDCRHFTIGETGFGTGLNFLAAWRLWLACAPENWQLHFVSVEKHPLQFEDLKRALQVWPQLSPMADQLLAQYPALVPGQHLLKFEQGRIHLHLLFGDAIEAFDQFRASDHPALAQVGHCMDAWFLDGFAPDKNPSLWNDKLYKLLAQLSRKGTTVATFTAAGNVRRGLNSCGFAMGKAPGFGKKREMLHGEFALQTPAPPYPKGRAIKAPWYRPAVNRRAEASSGRQAVVIGGGLAGSSSAYALAQRGWQVTLLEREPALAQGASGNAQGILYTKLSSQPGFLNQFTLSSYLYALRFYRHLTPAIDPRQLSFCGVLQLANSQREQEIQRKLQPLFAGHEQWVRFVDASEASDLAGTAVQHPACYFPQGGWLSPPAVCQRLCSHPSIQTLFNQDVLSLQRQSQGWQLLDAEDQLLARADVVVIANSRDATHFAQSQPLPLKTIRGQVTELAVNSSTLRTVICHEGYITPASNGRYSLGATFDLGDSDKQLRSDDHLRNLDSLKTAVPSLLPQDLDSINLDELSGRAGLRCTSPDYLPIVGPLHDQQAFIRDYAALRKDSRQPLDTPGIYHPDLYINVAHGSRGLTSTPLCSELLAALINNEPPPLPRALVQALSPARFVIRDLIRSKL